MKKLSLIATISLIVIAVTVLVEGTWWNIFWLYIDEENHLMYEKICEDIPNWNTYMTIASSMELIKAIAFGGLLLFFCKLFKNQNDNMRKTSLLGIIGLCLIILIMMYYFVSNMFGLDIIQPAFRLIINAVNIIGYILLIPFFYNLYKKSN